MSWLSVTQHYYKIVDSSFTIHVHVYHHCHHCCTIVVKLINAFNDITVAWNCHPTRQLPLLPCMIFILACRCGNTLAGMGHAREWYENWILICPVTWIVLFLCQPEWSGLDNLGKYCIVFTMARVASREWVSGTLKGWQRVKFTK